MVLYELKFSYFIVAKLVYEYDVCRIEDLSKQKDELTGRNVISDIQKERYGYLEMIMKDKTSLIDVNIKFDC
ncbi:hypothetical protein SAMN02745176_00397 [Lutispora thermophila DSM 19022]|uniref:Uncharacterized protein n=1 Tax=Lutispora thermophila DSM 19022 TaxID=1122184 RepID=A0A1M6BCX5_9FIRM|nr:hypothetical protein SAMN02745176_00397 [Lutispora thermophila DSM 19022]